MGCRPTGESTSILIDAAHDEASRHAKIACAKKLISQVVSTRFYLSSPAAKNIPISFFPKLVSPARVPRSIKRGVSRSSRTLNAGCGGRTSPSAILARTNGVCADGEVVWSWRSDAGAKVVKTLSRLTGDGGNQAWSPRRARRKPLKPLRREGRLFGSYLWFLPRAFHSHGGHGCGQHPAFPAPSLNREGESFAKLGRAGAARLRACALNAVVKGKPACARSRPRSHGRCHGDPC